MFVVFGVHFLLSSL